MSNVQEQEIMRVMVQLYCKGHRHTKQSLCPQCGELLDYAQKRIERCSQRETKTFCSSCSTQCYNPQMRKQIKMVMRYSGPRMLFHHPILVIRHALDHRQSKSKKSVG